MKKYCKAVVNIVVAIVVTLFAVLFLPKILAFFAPFVVGGVIAWLAGPLVNFFEKKVKLKRRAGSAFVIIVVIGLIVLAIYGLASVLIKEGIGLVQSFPELWSQVQQDLNELGTKLEKTYQTLPMAIRENLDGVIVVQADYESSGIIRLATSSIPSGRSCASVSGVAP